MCISMIVNPSAYLLPYFHDIETRDNEVAILVYGGGGGILKREPI